MLHCWSVILPTVSLPKLQAIGLNKLRESKRFTAKQIDLAQVQNLFGWCKHVRLVYTFVDKLSSHFYFCSFVSVRYDSGF